MVFVGDWGRNKLNYFLRGRAESSKERLLKNRMCFEYKYFMQLFYVNGLRLKGHMGRFLREFGQRVQYFKKKFEIICTTAYHEGSDHIINYRLLHDRFT